jgi:hypothetical protein
LPGEILGHRLGPLGVAVEGGLEAPARGTRSGSHALRSRRTPRDIRAGFPDRHS